MTTAEPQPCHRCRRLVRKQPVPWFGKVLGRNCARRWGIKPEKPARVRAPAREPAGETEDVLDGLAELLRADNERGTT